MLLCAAFQCQALKSSVVGLQEGFFFFNISCPNEESSFNPAKSWAEYWRDFYFFN